VGRVVLVTGVSRDFGGRLARALTADPAVERVIGVDVVPPHGDLGEVSFVRADIRNPVIAKVIAGEDVDTVVHISVEANPGKGGRAAMKEHNVIGSMQLLAACQKAPRLERLVVRSSTDVYGSSCRDPAMFTEDVPARRTPRSGYARDMVEVEAYVRGFARRRPDVSVTMLRTAATLGPGSRSRLAEYIRLPVVPTALGYDPRLQLLHETDLLEVLRHATVAGVHGTFNVAGSGVLMLSQAVRRLGRPTVAVPGPALGAVGTLGGFSGLAHLVEYLSFGRGVDTTRMREVLGFTADYTTPETFADFAASVPPGLLPTWPDLAGAGAGRG
jgi:UDP-glucose 4-epimerase